jgi:hypothetical protein
MPVSRDRDCYSLLKISEFYADAKVFVDAKVLTILSMAGRYNKPVQYGREAILQPTFSCANIGGRQYSADA